MKIIRFKAVITVIAVCFTVIILKAIWIELFYLNSYGYQYKKSIMPIVKVRGERGLIYDCKGKILAENSIEYKFFVDPKYFLKHNNLSETKFITFVDKAYSLNILQFIKKNHQKQFFILGELPAKDYFYVKSHMPIGFGILKLHKRYYPYSNDVSHIIGFCYQNGEGAVGLEKSYNTYLEGQTIFEHIRLTPFGTVLYSKKPENGWNLHLTINERVQNYLHYLLEKTLRKHKAEMVMGIVEKPDGAIVAMDDVPSYNNNKYYTYTNYKYIKDMPINFLFEPGSVMKIVTMSSALDSNTFSAREKLWCNNGYWPLDGNIIQDVEDNKFLTFNQVFAYSSNVCSAKIALKEGKKIFYHYLWEFGFGKKTGIDLPGEESGFIKDYLRIRPFDLATMAFGQGISVTEIQLARACATIANGGYLIKPHIVNYISKNKNIVYKFEQHPVRILKSQTVKKVKRILGDVVKYGTGIYAQLKGYKVGGKTGTAQVVSDKGGYSKHKYIGSFVEIFPLNKPRFVIIMTVVDPKGVNYGGIVAAPYVAKMASFLAAYYKIPGNNYISKKLDGGFCVKKN